MFFEIFTVLVISFITTYLSLYVIIPQLKKIRIVGSDLNKPDRPEIPEMGGLGVISGLCIGFMMIIAYSTFLGLLNVDLVGVLALATTVAIVGFIGIFDDLFRVRMSLKAALPVLAALPLMAIKAGYHTMKIPVIGVVDLGLVYPLVLVPIGITGAANAVNILGGFNGIEAGMGFVAAVSLAVVAQMVNATTSFIVLLILAASLLAFLFYNWYPAQAFIGDVGTLVIGAVIAASVILGDFEVGGIIIIIPYFVDALFKIFNGVPSEGWHGRYNEENGKLYPLTEHPVSLCQFVMKIAGGIKERTLVMTMMGIEAVFGTVAVLFYIWSR